MAPKKADNAAKKRPSKAPMRKASLHKKKSATPKQKVRASRRSKIHVPVGPGGVCIAGESLIDMLPRTTADGDPAYKPCPGGAPFNALMAATRLGMPVRYFAALSTDMFGEKLYSLLSNEGVNLDLVERFDRPTTLAFVSREPGQGEKYAFFKERAADRALTEKRVKSVMKSHSFDAVHMSLGAITLEDQQMRRAFQALFKISGQHGSVRSFDPNLRSNMIHGGSDSYRKKIEEFARHVDIFKLSDDDLQFLYGDSSGSEFAKKIFKMGPRLLIVTKGAEGATLYYPQGNNGWQGGEISVSPPGSRPNTINAFGEAAPVIDTVGAGDTFMGGLISGILSNRDGVWQGRDAPMVGLLRSGDWTLEAQDQLKRIMERASVCAAINCSRAGCDPPSSEDAQTAGRALGLSFAS